MQVTDEMVRVAAEEYLTAYVDDDTSREVAMHRALTAALAAMQDHVIVPREPTTVQVNAGVDADDMRTGFEIVKHIYRTMIAPAPSQLSKRGDAERDSRQEA